MVQDILMQNIRQHDETGAPATITLDIAKKHNIPIYDVQRELRSMITCGQVALTDRLRLIPATTQQ